MLPLDPDVCGVCTSPRSSLFASSDYLAIAEQYGVILLENVPHFSVTKNRSAMRRFITLLDVLYDASVRLVVSAAAEPQDLFHDSPPTGLGAGAAKGAQPTKEDESFAFQRAVSRLTEMQSKEYLQRVEQRKQLAKQMAR